MDRRDYLKTAFTFAICLVISVQLFARGGQDPNSKKNNNNNPALAAGCIPANEIIFLEFNNVKTRVEAGGLWWQDRANGVADYEVPRGSNSYALYAGGLWLAGTDVNGQLKAASSKFGQGVDYWAGPLDNKGTAEINAETCERWDRFFEISRKEVADFVLYNSLNDEERADVFPDGYEVPDGIKNWPGDGFPNFDDPNLAERLAPYVDVNGDNVYDWRDGDYPFYDLGATLNSNVDSNLISETGVIDCRAPRIDRSESATRPLFGDKTFWWIFNDKGNLHTETNAPSIGMEIHAQAFAFATNDQVNDMTFYNFELINRSTFTLTETYFASYVDPDLGDFNDDYVGCDVTRGFGYCYNGDDFDEDRNGQTGYGSTPAVIGIDFFEGPFQDPDGIDNEVGIRPGEALNGLGYGDSIADNERFGMRRFVYYNSGGGQNGDPNLAIHYYNYMRGIWQNGQRMRHGGDGLNSTAVEDIPTAFMFPGTSDPLGWGTVDQNGISVPVTNRNWTEDNPGVGQDRNAPGDRRFLQSAGPFTLEPGNVNDITVGVVFGQAETGGRLASLDVAFTADNKAQALFDNCFQVLDGPDAPDLTIQELDQELILYLTNSPLSNNFNEEYEEIDPNIVTPDTLLNLNPPRFYDPRYKFQGYQVFQLRSNDISISQVLDPAVSRLVFQCDIVDGDTTLVNYTFDENIQASIPVVQVEGANEGISHSIRVNEDLFASGNPRLINFKTYYYIAIAYASNRFKPYAQDVAPSLDNPFAPASDGQKTPYLPSRRTATGGSVFAVSAIPHDPTYESNGTVINSSYGDLVGITRWEGEGNGGNELRFTESTLDRIMDEKAWEVDSIKPIELNYTLGSGPINVKVVDPLNVVDADFVFKFHNDLSANIINDTARWIIENRTSGDDIPSERAIGSQNEQILKTNDFNWGLSVDVGQVRPIGGSGVQNNGYLNANINFKGSNWLTGVTDAEGSNPFNWILAGSVAEDGNLYGDRRGPAGFIDPNEDYENILGATWTPYTLAGFGRGTVGNLLLNKPAFNLASSNNSKLAYLSSVVIVLTKDKSKWTRCPVLESQEEIVRSFDGTEWLRPRKSLSIDKDGNYVDTTGLGNLTRQEIIDSLKSDNEDDAAFINPFGMGWFPGYALNLETGERFNMAYAEDTRYGLDNGADMQWNPTSTLFSGSDGNLVWGGKHYTYIFRNTTPLEKQREGIPNDFGSFTFSMNLYDGGERLRNMLDNTALQPFAWRTCSWMTIPLLQPGQELLASDVEININLSKPYAINLTNPVDTSLRNEGRPVYTFKTDGFAVQKGNTKALEDALVDVNVVPNPYYAISEYETSALDNLVKITNLPQNCRIKIFNMSGTLIREYNKTDPQNFLDWDMKNQAGIPISSGVYLIHVDVPGVGEKILKWFGVTRPVDLNNF